MHSFKLSAFVALLTTLTFQLESAGRHARSHRHGHHTAHRQSHDLPADYGQWSQVADCESAGWQVLGDAYPDSLGISRANFIAFGGRPMSPGPVSRTEQVMQIRTADRMIEHFHAGIPDRYGCTAW